MKNITTLILLNIFFKIILSGQTGSTNSSILSEKDLKYLEELTRDVVDSSRIYPGQKISPDFGGNSTGGILIRPGGRKTYPSFWIRDYAMSLECGFISSDEQKHMLLLTASTQCDLTWITSTGSLIPSGAIADHIRIDDGLPIYFPGTYDHEKQGGKKWGMVLTGVHLQDGFVMPFPELIYRQLNNSPENILKISGQVITGKALHLEPHGNVII